MNGAGHQWKGNLRKEMTIPRREKKRSLSLPKKECKLAILEK